MFGRFYQAIDGLLFESEVIKPLTSVIQQEKRRGKTKQPISCHLPPSLLNAAREMLDKSLGLLKVSSEATLKHTELFVAHLKCLPC